LSYDKLNITSGTKSTTIEGHIITMKNTSLSTDDSLISIGPGQNFTGDITVDGKVFKIIGGIIYSVENA
jgi:hypothetical protein